MKPASTSRLCKAILAASLLIASLPALARETADSTAVQAAQSRYPEDIEHAKLLQSTKIIPFNSHSATTERDSLALLINQFYLNQYRHFQDPEAPMFMFMTGNAKWAMGIGGMVKLHAWMDWNGHIDDPDFSPYLITLPPDPTSRVALAATPQSSALTFTLIGRDTPVGNILAYIEGGFSGYKNVGFKLKKAYVIMGDWTVGYATSTFIDGATETPVIDSGGPSGTPSKTNMLVRWFHTFKKGWSLAAGAEISGNAIDSDGVHTAACTKFTPDLVALVQYGWGGKSHVRLAGMGRLLTYRNLLDKTNHTVPGWAVQLSAITKVIPNLSAYGNFVFGMGHDTYINDLSHDNFDLLANPSKPGSMYAPKSLCATLGMKYNILSNLWVDVALGHSRHLPKGKADDDAFKYGNYLAANIFWNITPRLRTGAEYTVGMRKNFDGQRGTVDRAALLFQLSF